MRYKTVLWDLDGTLLNSNKEPRWNGCTIADMTVIDAIGNTGFPGIGHGQGNALGIVVRTQDPVVAMELLVLGLLTDLAPDGGVAPGKSLAGEPAVHAGSLVPGYESRFDGNGTGAAEGVPDEVTAPVVGQHHHSGSQGLPQGRIVADGPVAPLVQSCAGGVQV